MDEREDKSKRPVTAATWAICDELFKIFIDSLQESMTTFSYSILPDTGAGPDHGMDPNDPACWIEVHIEENLQEMVGGEGDGTKVFSGFMLAVEPLMEALSTPEAKATVTIDATTCRKDNPTVDIHGKFKGRPFSVAIHLEPTSDADVGMRIFPDGSFTYVGGPDDLEEDEADGD